MDIKGLRAAVKDYEIVVQHAHDAAEIVKESDDTLKVKGRLSNMELRAVKKFVKAKVKGKLEDLKEQSEATDIIHDILTDITIVDVSVVERTETEQTPHDPETGEVLTIEHQETELVAVADTLGSTRQGESEARDSSPITPRLATIIDEPFARDTRTADEILGTEPIPPFLKRERA